MQLNPHKNNQYIAMNSITQNILFCHFYFEIAFFFEVPDVEQPEQIGWTHLFAFPDL